MLIKYIKSIFWRVVKHLSCTGDALCLKVKMVLPMLTILPVGSLSLVGKKYGLNVFVGHCTYKILRSDWMLNNHKIFLCIFRIDISKKMYLLAFSHMSICLQPHTGGPLKQSWFQLLGQLLYA